MARGALRDVLRIGAYQIHHLTRVPVHAAVAATVEVAKRAHGARSAGFANAVLRRLAQEAAQGVSPAPAPPTATDPRSLARQYSHPAWLVTRWVARFGVERTEALLVHTAARSAVHLQPARWPIEQLREAFQAAAIPFTEVEGLPGVAVRGVRVHDLPGYPEGAFVVQDPAQALALEHIPLPEGVTIWDACAAPGGKAARLSARGPVLASDPRRARLPRLVDTVRRAAPDVWIVCADALAAPIRAATLDAVLLDVPCSATGTIAKHPDARWHLSPKRIERLAQLQATLLDAVATAVRPGGVLAYLTCSLEQEENDYFATGHPIVEALFSGTPVVTTVVSLIDLDTVQPGLVHYDIGDCLRSCCNPAGEMPADLGEVHFDLELAGAILHGYLIGAARLLTVPDLFYLYDAIRLIPFELGLRFLTDPIAGDRYFKVGRRGDNLYRARVQFALTTSIEANEHALRNLTASLTDS